MPLGEGKEKNRYFVDHRKACATFWFVFEQDSAHSCQLNELQYYFFFVMESVDTSPGWFSLGEIFMAPRSIGGGGTQCSGEGGRRVSSVLLGGGGWGEGLISRHCRAFRLPGTSHAELVGVIAAVSAVAWVGVGAKR